MTSRCERVRSICRIIILLKYNIIFLTKYVKISVCNILLHSSAQNKTIRTFSTPELKIITESSLNLMKQSWGRGIRMMKMIPVCRHHHQWSIVWCWSVGLREECCIQSSVYSLQLERRVWSIVELFRSLWAGEIESYLFQIFQSFWQPAVSSTPADDGPGPGSLADWMSPVRAEKSGPGLGAISYLGIWVRFVR